MRMQVTFCTAIVLLMASFGEAEAQLDDARFAELIELVVPADKTHQIKWLPDLLSAQKIALDQQKPLFIWSMDGHPLGCV